MHITIMPQRYTKTLIKKTYNPKNTFGLHPHYNPGIVFPLKNVTVQGENLF